MFKTLMMLVYSAPYLPIALGVLIAIKIISFFMHKRASWKMRNIVYFKEYNIIESSSVESRDNKKFQNLMSKIILSVAAINALNVIINLWFNN